MGDPQLRLSEDALNWDPAEITVPPVPAIPPGSDPMSVMLAAIAPQIATAVTQGVTEALAREERFAANVAGARTSYQTADGAARQQIQSSGELAEPGSAAAGVGATNSAGVPAGEAGQLGQMMGMPMQMAQQAAQIPMQLAGMAAAIPQGIMQGVQSAMQQVGQTAGGAGEKNDPESDQSGERSRDELRHADSANEVPPRQAPPEGAAGPSNAERAPGTESGPTPEVPQQQPHKPAATRPATSGPESVL
jgi:hypothetical protein